MFSRTDKEQTCRVDLVVEMIIEHVPSSVTEYIYMQYIISTLILLLYMTPDILYLEKAFANIQRCLAITGCISVVF